MEILNIVLAGLGGQGVLFMTKILAQTALDQGFEVMGAETHGMAQRGGSVVSHLRLGTIKSSLIRSGAADCVLALDENEAYRNIHFLKRGGKIFVNTSSNVFPINNVKEYFKENSISCYTCSATKMAAQMGAPMASNLVMVGFFASFDLGVFSPQPIRDTVKRVSPEKFREVNLKVLDTSLGQLPQANA